MTFCLLFPSFTVSSSFVSPQDMWRQEFWKVIGGIISCSAETQSERLSASAERRGKKKLLKFIGRKKESTAEYITQHQLFQGQERSDCSSGTLSSSQWDWWDYIVQEKPGIKAAEWQAPNPYTQSVMVSLHQCPHIYVSPDSMCGLVFVAQASHWPISSFKFTNHATPRCSSSLGCSDLW